MDFAAGAASDGAVIARATAGRGDRSLSTAFWTGIAGAMFGLTRAFRADEPPPRGSSERVDSAIGPAPAAGAGRATIVDRESPMPAEPHPAHPTDDTSPDAAAVVLECLRRMSPVERLEAGCRMSRRGRRLAINAIKRRHPEADETEIRLRAIELAYGASLADDVRRWLRDRSR